MINLDKCFRVCASVLAQFLRAHRTLEDVVLPREMFADAELFDALGGHEVGNTSVCQFPKLRTISAGITSNPYDLDRVKRLLQARERWQTSIPFTLCLRVSSVPEWFRNLSDSDHGYSAEAKLVIESMEYHDEFPWAGEFRGEVERVNMQ